MKLDPAKLLDLLGIDFVDKGSRLQLRCPLHDDKTPSAAFYPESGLFRCFAEELTLDALGFYARVKELTREQAERVFKERFGWEPEPPPVHDELGAQSGLAKLEDALKAARPRLTRVEFAQAGEKLDKLMWLHSVFRVTDVQFNTAVAFLSEQFAKINA
jgi:DNA primase